MKITWNYIAGFFDGEGNVNTPCGRTDRSVPTPKITVAQSGESGRVLLLEIAFFLFEEAEIRSIVYERPRVKPHHASTWILHIGKRDSVAKFLTRMTGRVFIKKVIVEDTLRFLTVFPSTQKTHLENLRRKHRRSA